jgi:hypothetical protein
MQDQSFTGICTKTLCCSSICSIETGRADAHQKVTKCLPVLFELRHVDADLEVRICPAIAGSPFENQVERKCTASAMLVQCVASTILVAKGMSGLKKGTVTRLLERIHINGQAGACLFFEHLSPVANCEVISLCQNIDAVRKRSLPPNVLLKRRRRRTTAVDFSAEGMCVCVCVLSRVCICAFECMSFVHMNVPLLGFVCACQAKNGMHACYLPSIPLRKQVCTYYMHAIYVLRRNASRSKAFEVLNSLCDSARTQVLSFLKTNKKKNKMLKNKNKALTEYTAKRKITSGS